MGWVESPSFFSVASETARDVAQEYVEADVGDLPPHHLEDLTNMTDDNLKDMIDALSETERTQLKYLLEVYIDDFIGAATASSPEQLNHIARALLHAIHDVFPEHLHTPDDQPASMKKILKGEGQWSPIKEILGWIFDGINKTVQLPPEKIDAILATMNAMLRSTTGVKFQDFQKLTGKLHHASIGIPTGKSLMTQFNRQLAREPKLVWMRRGSDLRNAMHLWAAMLRRHKMNPTKAKELVQGEPDYLIIVDASGSDGLGGVVLSEKSQVPATVFRHPWPEDIKQMLADNILTINDFELLAE